MIGDLDRYHGIVLRQILVGCGRPIHVGTANLSGRVDAFSVERAAFQVKHSSKRLSPWYFTYPLEHCDELDVLARTFDPVWVMLVCGADGVVCVPHLELKPILRMDEGHAGWIRVSRSRNAMYRISGHHGGLARAKPRGVQPFLADVFRMSGEASPA